MNPAAPVTRVRIISYLQLDGELRTAATEVRGGIGDDSAVRCQGMGAAVQTATR
jgi:hypothetical protein